MYTCATVCCVSVCVCDYTRTHVVGGGRVRWRADLELIGSIGVAGSEGAPKNCRLCGHPAKLIRTIVPRNYCAALSVSRWENHWVEGAAMFTAE